MSVCLNRRILLSAETFSFTVQHLIGPERFIDIFGEGITILQREIAKNKNNKLNAAPRIFLETAKNQKKHKLHHLAAEKNIFGKQLILPQIETKTFYVPPRGLQGRSRQLIYIVLSSMGKLFLQTNLLKIVINLHWTYEKL